MTRITKEFNLNNANKYIRSFEKVITSKLTRKLNGEALVTGVDLGTANIVVSVVNENKEAVAGELRAAQVVRDGLVVDFMGAIRIVKELKVNIESRLNTRLSKAAVGIPPGTSLADARGIINVVESADLDVIEVIDEPSAAARVLNIDSGVVVDVGGGTTGISVVEEGRVIYTADEATGGIHFTYVIAGNYNISIAEAEKIKKQEEQWDSVAPILVPSIEKVASIVDNHLQKMAREPEVIYLVGGSCCFPSFSQVIERCLGIKTVTPYNPLLITPLGIALSSIDHEVKEKVNHGYLY